MTHAGDTVMAKKDTKLDFIFLRIKQTAEKVALLGMPRLISKMGLVHLKNIKDQETIK